ncbi:hypothetical protein [Vibrio phage BONAISHI]|nr:hypothetical protein [Vibrio phage BONAISHI]
MAQSKIFSVETKKYVGLGIDFDEEWDAWKEYRDKLTTTGASVDVYEADGTPVTVTFTSIALVHSTAGKHVLLEVAPGSVADADTYSAQIASITPVIHQTAQNTYDTFLYTRNAESLSKDGNAPINHIYRALQHLNKI